MLVFISVGGVTAPIGGEDIIRAPALGGGEPVLEEEGGEGGEGGEDVIRAPALGGGEPVLEDDEPVLGGDNNEDPILDGGEPVLEDDEPVLGGDNNEEFCAATS
jgi:hypothetical protein